MHFIFVLNFVKFYGKEGNHFSLEHHAYILIIYIRILAKIIMGIECRDCGANMPVVAAK